ncbi:hypothetical protein [Phnomibacter ginsenosidimutans]|uniref:hypothetical protein n=1 Tax=Phnomibacter ginsenosidimutans TaxID=2676868 RepID=UPI0018D211E4|nr:hypothetical protein [Phnomibacter ginsenosidimutans]
MVGAGIVLLNVDASRNFAYHRKNLQSHVGLLHAGNVYMAVITFFEQVAVPEQGIAMQIGNERNGIVPAVFGKGTFDAHFVFGAVDNARCQCKKQDGNNGQYPAGNFQELFHVVVECGAKMNAF